MNKSYPQQPHGIAESMVPISQIPQYVQIQLQQYYPQLDLIAKIAAENEQLHHKLSQKQFAEQANSEAIRCSDNRIYTYGKNGCLKLLMNRCVEGALRITYLLPSQRKPLYIIYLNKASTPLCLCESDYLNDKKFLSAIQELEGVEISFGLRNNKIATLLRQAVSKKITTIDFYPYAGWTFDCSDCHYEFFENRTTHCVNDALFSERKLLGKPTSAVTTAAVNLFWPYFKVITNNTTRWLMFLWFHAAALYSLLRQLDCEIQLALCIYSTDADCLTYVKRLFSWFGDSPLSMDIAPSDFNAALLARKDQPLLVCDQGRLENSKVNMKTLETLLINKRAPLKSKETASFPVQALPTILSDRVSAISCAPEVLTLEVDDGEFDRDAWAGLAEHSAMAWDYIASFVAYTEEHLSELRSALSHGWNEAVELSDGDLNERCTQTMGVLLGLDHFLTGFTKSCVSNLTISPISPLDDSMIGQLRDLMTQTSEKGENTGLADLFIEIARDHIRTGILSLTPIERCPTERSNLVLFDDYHLYFTRPAFCEVCKSLRQSRPVMLRALADAELLMGKRINNSTFMVRIGTYNVHGIHRTLCVYSVDRAAFDEVGEPLLLEEDKP